MAEAQRNPLTAVLLDTPVAEQPAVRGAASAMRERWLDLQRSTVCAAFRPDLAGPAGVRRGNREKEYPDAR